MNENQELRSLKRGLKVLSLLNQTETLSITELARRLGLPRTTAERILLTLLAEGYVQRIPDDRRYRLSAKVCSLSGGFSDDCRLVQAATPMLFKVTEQIGWPLAIATPLGDQMVLRTTTDPATSLWLTRRRVGAEIAMLNSSSGLVAYAFSSTVQRAALRPLLTGSANPVNRDRASDDRTLEMFIRPVVENGFAFQPPPNNRSEQSIAFPIFLDGKYVASLLMIYMTSAMNSATVTRNYAPHLRVLADRIAQVTSSGVEPEDESRLGFPPFSPVGSAMGAARAF